MCGVKPRKNQNYLMCCTIQKCTGRGRESKIRSKVRQYGLHHNLPL